jgi:hypothetical protein
MLRKLLFGGVTWLALCALVPDRAVAQRIASSDSLAVVAAVAAATQQYVQQAQPESVLFNGPEYVNRNSPGTIGHQYFGSADPQLGTITYRNAQFREILLSYDLALDQVVMTYPSQAVTVMLVPEKIGAFSLGNHQFVRLLADSITTSQAPTGFYEVLLTGPASLLARHTKRVQQTTVQQNLRLEFRQTDQLFVRTASTVAPVDNLKDVLNLLPAHKAEVQRYARQQQLRFSGAQREASFSSALRYYASLPQ